jgi:hypothetical protein
VVAPPYASIYPFIYTSTYLHNHLILIYVSSSTLPPTVPSTGVVQTEAVSIPEASAASDATTSSANPTTSTDTAEGNEGNGD